MKLLFSLMLMLSWNILFASNNGILKTVEDSALMSSNACKALVQKVWLKNFKRFTPKPIFVDYSDRTSEQKTNVSLTLNSQILFGVYIVNNFSNNEENFVLQFETDRIQFGALPPHKTPMGGASCRILHLWRENSSAQGIQWIKLNLIGKNSKEILQSKKIKEK